jgi:hypothetical protein
MFGQKRQRKTFHGYAAATQLRPEWYVGYLVFQAGVPRQRAGSLTGGGQIYGHEYGGFFTPVLYPNSPGVPSFTGGGQIVAMPAELLALAGGAYGIGS